MIYDKHMKFNKIITLLQVPTFFFPFGREINDTVLIGVDDGATPGIPLGVAFPFFGITQTELFVRNMFTICLIVR